MRHGVPQPRQDRLPRHTTLIQLQVSGSGIIQAIYEGKGTCFNCHGTSGKGDGPAGAILNPTPRNFTNPKFHKNRTDGEMFWVIKNGSAGTGMVPLIGTAITEEEAWYVINYERSFEGK